MLQFVGLLIFFVLFGVSRVLAERALKKLSQKDKASLVDAFSNMRAYYIIPLIVIVLAFLGLVFFFPRYIEVAGIMYIVFMLAGVILSNVYVYTKVRRLGLPETYVRGYMVSRGISFIGALIVILTVILDWV